MKKWSNFPLVIYKRTYSRTLENSKSERWSDTVDRAITGNVRGFELPEKEIQRLRYFAMERKALCAGRGLWYSGSPSHYVLGGAALNNCWGLVGDDWKNLVIGQDLLMLGGGVGLSVEHRYVSKMCDKKGIRRGVNIVHKATKDAAFIVPDSREGWNELVYRVLEAYFVTGKSFSYSTYCIRGAGEAIRGFGGVASGPMPLIRCVDKICKILQAREGTHVRPLDVADVMCAIGEMVVSGNVRRSAIMILGDGWDKEFLRAKRWDLGNYPTQRAYANYSVVCDDIDDLHKEFWKSYEIGEPIGIVNRKNMRKYGRMGELMKSNAVVVNPCGEATLEPFEPCNLQEIGLHRMNSIEEFEEAAVLMHRWGKRVTCENYHYPQINEVIQRNRKVGTGITGCLQSPLFKPEYLDRVYAAIQRENRSYSEKLGIPISERTTVVKPSGTFSKLMDTMFEGAHAAYSRWMIQRVRMASNDALIPILRAAGHHIEPLLTSDGKFDHGTQVVDFYLQAPNGYPVADEDWDTWKQLDVLKMIQKHWSDQAVSVTVYYRREEIPKIKEWLSNNLDEIKSISFLCHGDHGFRQSPKEAITEEEYELLSSKIKPIDIDSVESGGEVEGGECDGGMCPMK